METANVLIRMLLFIVATVAQATKFNNELGKPVVVIVAPSVWDSYYKEKFHDLVSFDMDLARAILPTDNVVVIADKATMPYLQGRSHDMLKKLPDDVLLEANIYDVFIKDFAPMGLRETLKFHYSPKSMDTFIASQIDKSIMRFLGQNNFKYSKNSSLVLSGSQVVDNGVDKAIIDKAIYVQNKNTVQEWSMTVQLMSAFKSVAFVDWANDSGPMGDNITTRLDDWMAWIDEDILSVSSMSFENHNSFLESIKKGFNNAAKVVELPDLFAPEFWNNHTGVCGLYTTLLRTDDFIYVPAFGNDPENWMIGQSTKMDKMAYETVQVNTRRDVVAVNIPRSICQIGASLKSLTWVVHGDMADKLINMARHKSNDDVGFRV